MIQAILKELDNRRNFFKHNDTIESIYFGGGTPSLLSESELSAILHKVYALFPISQNAEITLECNPDDIEKEKLKSFKSLGVNRLSIGIQSFEEEILRWMNRSHNALQAYDCAVLAAEVGFKNLTIDLIYGIPHLNNETWINTLKKAIGLPINHISCYSLTLEDHTPYKRLVDQHKYLPPDDDLATQQYLILANHLSELGWDHYEVSNFCKEGNLAVHNTAYWQRKPYLGIGPSAHSFDGSKRYWNVASNKEYIACLTLKEEFYESEELTIKDVVNEVIMTGFRTKWGVRKADLNALNYALDNAKVSAFKQRNWLTEDHQRYCLTEEGFLYADHIASEFFML